MACCGSLRGKGLLLRLLFKFLFILLHVHLSLKTCNSDLHMCMHKLYMGMYDYAWLASYCTNGVYILVVIFTCTLITCACILHTYIHIHVHAYSCIFLHIRLLGILIKYLSLCRKLWFVIKVYVCMHNMHAHAHTCTHTQTHIHILHTFMYMYNVGYLCIDAYNVCVHNIYTVSVHIVRIGYNTYI